MRKVLLVTLLGACFAQSANAILLERTPQGSYNTGVAPQVNYDELARARKHPVAPQADDVFIPRVYTYNNNTSEYLRDELGLPRVKADSRLNQYDVTYIPVTDQFKRIETLAYQKYLKELKEKSQDYIKEK